MLKYLLLHRTLKLMIRNSIKINIILGKEKTNMYCISVYLLSRKKMVNVKLHFILTFGNDKILMHSKKIYKK